MEEIDAEQLRERFRQMVRMDAEQPPAGYLGPGIWIRLQKRFRIRQTEWLLASITFLWGAVMLLPGNVFSLPDYSGFKAIFGSEVILGLGAMIVGFSRLVGLFINGARKNVTPHIRMVSACIGCLVFFGICYCYVLSRIFSDWVAIYPVFVVVEIINAHNAARDVGESHSGRTGQVH